MKANGVYEYSDFMEFTNKRLGTFRAIYIGPDIWFIGTDVAKCMGLKSPSSSINMQVENKYKTICIIAVSGSNYTTTVTLINEAGLYDFAMKARTPRGKMFKAWVLEEVLPSLNKNGTYTDNLNVSIDELLTKNAKLKDDLLSEVKLRAMLETSPDCCSVGTVAKLLKQNGYNIGQKRLFDWLRANNYLSVQPSSYNVPLDWAIEAGIFQINVNKLIDYTRSNPKRFCHVPMVTAAGRSKIMMAYINSIKANQDSLKLSKLKDKRFEDDDGFIVLQVIPGGQFDRYMEKRVVN